MLGIHKIKGWTVDFNDMTLRMAGGETFYLYELKDGRLAYMKRRNDWYPKPFETTDPDFDELILRAWTDFVFERDILLKDNKTESKI